MSPILIKGLVAASGIGLGGVGIWQLNEYMTPRTLGDKINKEGLTFLSFTDDSKQSEWSAKVQNHKGNGNSETAPIKFSNIFTTETGTTTNEDWKILRNKCKEVSNMRLGQTDEENNLQRLRNWCVTSPATIPSTPTVGTAG